MLLWFHKEFCMITYFCNLSNRKVIVVNKFISSWLFYKIYVTWISEYSLLLIYSVLRYVKLTPLLSVSNLVIFNHPLNVELSANFCHLISLMFLQQTTNKTKWKLVEFLFTIQVYLYPLIRNMILFSHAIHMYMLYAYAMSWFKHVDSENKNWKPSCDHLLRRLKTKENVQLFALKVIMVT